MCLVAIALMLAACAGSHYDISADRLNYPASLSPVLHDEQGKPCYLGEDLNSLGTFSFEMTSVGFLYSLIGTSIDPAEIMLFVLVGATVDLKYAISAGIMTVVLILVA